MSQDVHNSSSFNFIPFPWNYNSYDSNVGLKIIDYNKTPILQTKDRNYYVGFKDQKEMLLKNSLRYKVDEDYKVTKARIEKMFELMKEVHDIRDQYPNVPMTVLYSSQIDTLYSYITSDDEPDPISAHQQGKLYDKGRFLYRKGDGSIEIT